ncbi:MAG: cAMP phosphodiesterase [Vulcanococcus sp.]
MRSSACRLALLLLPLALTLAPMAAVAAPASEADMSLYTRIGALNVCIARAAGIEFDKAVAVAGETIAQVIQGQHEGVIAQVGSKPLTIDELRKGAINSAVLGAVEVCPDEVPADVRKKVDQVLKNRTGTSAPAKK